jgi:hypothetical protein
MRLSRPALARLPGWAASDEPLPPRAVLGCLLAAALLICLRLPHAVASGRFWAEEGKVFFARTFILSPWHALWLPYGGYLNLVANAGTLAARWVMPLRLAPYLTMAVGLAFQLLPPLLVLTATDAWLRPRRVRVLAVLVLLLVPGSEEVFLQALHCQFELSVCCGIILALHADEWRRAPFRLAILLLAPLTGPGAVALVPVFLLRAALERTAMRVAQAAALGAGAAIQMLFFFSFTHDAPRGYQLDPAILLSTVTLHHLAVPFLGMHLSTRIGAATREMLVAGQVPILAVVLPPLAAACIAIPAWRGRIGAPAVWLFVAALFLAGITYYGAIGAGPAAVDSFAGERYAFAPQSLFALGTLAAAATGAGVCRRIFKGLTAWLLVIGFVQYFAPWGITAKGPSFRPEVAAWQADPHYVIRIWPKGWDMRLDR